MAEWRDADPSNEPRTCLWCGRALRPKREYATVESLGFEPPQYGSREWKAAVRSLPIVGYGDYGDGFFCGLRCGYLFGEAMAKNGRRLKPHG